MIYSKINNTDLTASKLILGTDGFGTEMSEEASFEMLDAFVEAGGNIIDTASYYADWLGMGKSISEKTIGKWLAKTKKRDEIIISTKGGHPRAETMHISRLSEAEIMDDFENSLINLQTDYIDIYWLHRDDEKLPVGGIIESLNKVLETKKAKYIAVSNWSFDRMKEANDYAKSHGLKGLIAGQIQYSIAKPNPCALNDGIWAMIDGEYEKYSNSDLNVFAFSSQAQGFFALMDKGGVDALTPNAKKNYYNETNIQRFERLKELAKSKNTDVASLVVATLISDDNVNTFSQVGPRTIDQLNVSLKSVDIKITPEERSFIING